MFQYDTIISPCVSICRLDSTGICIGCYRSVKEIREWYILDDVAKADILKQIEKRK